MEVRKIPKKTVTIIEPKRSIIVDKEKYRQKKVAAYCRVSTDSEEQITSYTNQKKVYTEMIAKKPEWQFAGMYADEGISGTRADKRPEFKRMINDCLDGKIDYIVTKSVSRFARNTVECLEYVRMLKAREIGIFFEEQNIDTLTSDSELYLVIYAGFAQSESESISKNVTWSVRKKFEEGKPIFMYKRFIGYKKGEDGMPEIVPEEAKIIERIFDLYLAGATAQIISDTLRSENVTVPGKTATFSKGTIMNILMNDKYCGDSILQKTVTIDCIGKIRRKNTGEAPMYYVQNSHPAIVSRETYNKVQEEIARRRAKTPGSQKTALTATGKYSKYALTDVIVCGVCGTRFRRCTWSKYGKKKVVWRCINRLDNGTKYCKDSPTVDEETIKQAIVRALNKFNEQDTFTYNTLMKATIGEAIGLNGGSDEIDLLERRIEALNRKMIALVNESVQSGTDVESHEDEFRDISSETAQLQQRIEVIRQSEADDQSVADRLQKIQQTIADRANHRYEYDDSIVRQMIECIKIHPDLTIEVIFGGGYIIEETLNTD